MSCPVSWMRLERFVLQELSSADRDEVSAHVDACGACARHLRFIREDQRPMPELGASGAAATPWRWRWLIPVAMAAMGLLWASMRDAEPPGQRVAIKGGVLELSVVRERQGVVEENAVTYIDGDRFKVLVTCPVGQRSWQLVGFDGGRPGTPLNEGSIPCGNRVALPGSVAPVGDDPVAVCLALHADPGPFRDPVDLGEEAACVFLWPSERN